MIHDGYTTRKNIGSRIYLQDHFSDKLELIYTALTKKKLRVKFGLGVAGQSFSCWLLLVMRPCEAEVLTPRWALIHH